MSILVAPVGFPPKFAMKDVHRKQIPSRTVMVFLVLWSNDNFMIVIPIDEASMERAK